MNGKTSYAEQLERLLESCFEELQEMSDEEVLGGESPVSVKDRAMLRIERAAVAAGRRRMAAAKRGKITAFAQSSPVTDISVAAARAYVIRAATNSQVTLAARKLDEMSDEDVLRLYQQIRDLEAHQPKQGS